VDVVTTALGNDSRIGPKYLKGALGYGGPCFPRDNIAFSALAREIGVCAAIPEATDVVNNRQIKRIVDLVSGVADPGIKVAVLGMAYKPQTPVIEQSQGVMIAKHIAEAGFMVTIYDPFAMASALAVLRDLATGAPSPEAAVRDADVIVITTPEREFAEMDPQALAAKTGPHKMVIDCWRSLPRERFGSVAHLVYPGVGDHVLRATKKPVERPRFGAL
jgi:UDPglucose 6-dehydrogenase